jgi:deazaflavin-dependent oxidoreductase (nitroreductase family)
MASMHRATAAFTHQTARLRPVAALWGRIHSQTIIRTRGRVGAAWLGAPVLVLEAVGRRSGKVRRVPVIYARDGESYILLAANAGNDRPPSWWLNVQASETVDVFVRGRRLTMRWREAAPGEEHDRLFEALSATYPPSRYYPAMTRRALPVLDTV